MITFSYEAYYMELDINPKLGDANRYAHSDLLLRNRAGRPFAVSADHPNKDTKVWTLVIPYSQLDEFRYFMFDTKGLPLAITVTEPVDAFTAMISNNDFEIIEDRYPCDFSIILEMMIL